MTGPAPRQTAGSTGRAAVGTRRAVVDVVVLVAVLALAVTPLLPVYGGSAAVPALVVGLVAGTALAVVGTWGRWAAWLVTVVAVLLVVVLGTPLTGAPTLAGLVPTPRGAGQVLTASFTTWMDALTLDPPLGGTGDVLLAPFLLTFLGALLALTLALRTRPTVGALAGVVLLVVVVVSALLGTATLPVPPLVTGTVVVTVLLAWAALRPGSGAMLADVRQHLSTGSGGRTASSSSPRSGARRRPSSTGALLGLVVVGSLVLAPVTAGEPRFVLRDHVVPPFDPTAYPSPLAGFRSYVKADDKVLFTVKGLPEGARVRLAVMDRYDGTVWNVAGSRAAQGSGEFRRVGSAVSTDDEGVEAEVTFTIEGLSGVWLPTVGSATSFDVDQSTARDLRYNDATGAAVLTSGVSPDFTYTERVVVPNLDVRDSDIGAARSADVVLPDDTGVSGALSRQAASVAQDATTPVGQTRALATWLSENGYFSHGLDGEHPSLPGHGAARMSRLLDAPPMVGDGEQYASALALMARSMNLRARVVIGFVPGSGDAETAAQAEPKVTDDGVVEVRGKDVQAWVEVAFAGVGWVAFDATPPTSRQATEQQEEQQTHSQPQVLQPPVQPPPPQTEPEDDARPPQTDSPAAARQGPGWLRVVGRVAGGLGLLALLASPVLAVLVVKARRRWRRRRAESPAHLVTGGWAEIVDAAVDLRRVPSPVDTRRESAAVIGAGAAGTGVPASGAAGASDPELPVRLADLAVRADRAAFASSPPSPDEAEQYWSDVDETVRSLRHDVPWRTRMAGRVSVRSLRTRRAGERRTVSSVRRRGR